ncbi:MAG: FAD-dependent oxidoreductase [Armatimonadetes bacterium]|nr:FAD-dependent oxidoreductase [Armatimonadota bacterium]
MALSQRRGDAAIASVIVIGGGLAGLSAACALADLGFAVSLIERRSLLGGMATSLRVRGLPEPVDNCQHVLMRSCTALLDFYARIGVRDQVRFDPEIAFIDERGAVSSLAAARLPAPLHLAPGFARLRFLTLRDKLAIAKAFLGALPGGAGSSEESFAHWLQRRGQTERTVDAFWRPVIASALNEEPERVSASYALLVLRETFLARRDGWELGVPKRPLTQMHAAPAETYLSQRHARLLYRAEATRLQVEGDAVTGVLLADGTRLRADYYLSAVPYPALFRLLPPQLVGHPFFSRPRGMQPSPIVAAHFWLDRPVTPLPHAVLLGRSIHWFFNKTHDFGPRDGGFHLALVTSAAHALVSRPRQDLLRQLFEEIRDVLPEARYARLLHAVVFKERCATFAPLPGCDTLRLPAQTPLRNLFLAGDWTDTGWPATMEGAVRSGMNAARTIAAASGLSPAQQFI